MRFGSKLRLGMAPMLLCGALLAQPTDADWPSYGGTHSAWRYSSLDQVSVANVSKLVPVWAFQSGDYANALQSTPIVIDGVMYLSTASNWVYALDAATGAVKWKYEYGDPTGRVPYSRQNRGVAVGHGLVFMGTHDGRLVAIDQNTGKEVWRVAVNEVKQCGCNISAAPLVVKDLVVVVGTGGDTAYRGDLTAFDAKTGRFAWRFYVIPGPGEPGNETWAGDSWKFGGGAPWMTGSYDPDLDLIYWGTANAAGDFYGDARLGDNLYTASILALEADTGQLRWHYQEVPHDVWDYDSAYEAILIDRPVRGRTRKLIVHFNKSGYAFVLDRVTGELIKPWPYAEDVTWVEGITEDGQLIGRNEPRPGKPADVCPSALGAKGWNQAAFSPRTGWLYTTNLRICNELFVRKQAPREGVHYIGGFVRLRLKEGAAYHSSITAFDPVTGERRWHHPYKYLLMASVLATAGDLVFSGDSEGNFFALDARDGEKLWSFQTGSGNRGSAVSYEVDGRQYIATPSGWGGIGGVLLGLFPDMQTVGGRRGGSTLFAFALPEDSE